MSIAATTRHKLQRGARLLTISSLAIANTFVAILLWTTCLSSLVSPEEHPHLTLTGLLFPIFLLLNLTFFVPWLLVSRKWAILPIASTALCWGYIRDYIPLNFTSQPTGKCIKILSYNIYNLYVNNEYDGRRTVDYILGSNADIICLQECPEKGEVADKLLEGLDSAGYSSHIQNTLLISTKGIFADEPFYWNEKGDDSGSGTLSCLVSLEEDTLLVCCTHLESTGLSIEERSNYQQAIESHDRHMIKASGLVVVNRLASTAGKRARQVHVIDSIIDAHKEPVVVCGDFNDTPVSYSVQNLSQRLTNTFTESGNGPGISFNVKGFPVRIDHIFVSQEWQSAYTFVDSKTNSSDHRPIITYLQKR